jgi:ribonucleoside-diphosphate reductase alpha chain
MGKETKQDTLQQIVDELASVGARGGQDVTNDKVADLMAKALKGMNGSDKDTLMALLSLALLQNRRPEVTEIRPQALECDVVRFQNNKEKWVALVGLLDGYPYEIFTGLQDDDEGIMLPKTVTKGKIIKQVNPDGTKRYDFQFENKRGYKTTVEGLSEKFNPEYWNYAKLISGVLRYRMPIDHVIKLVSSLQLKSENINTWKNGVERALKKYVTDGTEARGQKCPVCGHEPLVYQEGCLICKNCGASRCG